MATAVLHQFPPAGRMPSISPYCWKVQMALVVHGIDYEVANTLSPKKANRRGKLPYLELDGHGYEDSTHIVRELEGRGDRKLVPDDPALAAEADILEDWADESLYWHAVRAKFDDDQGWELLKDELAKHLPAKMLRIALPLVRRDLRQKLEAQGMLKRSRSLVDEELERHLEALETRLASRDYLVGDSLSIADLAVTAMLGQLTVGLTPPFAERIARREKLSAYIGRVFEETVPPL